jgi:hypothetical protein
MIGPGGNSELSARCFHEDRMVAGSAEVIESEETLVAAARNQPNCLVLPFSVELIRLAA